MHAQAVPPRPTHHPAIRSFACPPLAGGAYVLIMSFSIDNGECARLHTNTNTAPHSAPYKKTHTIAQLAKLNSQQSLIYAYVALDFVDTVG